MSIDALKQSIKYISLGINETDTRSIKYCNSIIKLIESSDNITLTQLVCDDVIRSPWVRAIEIEYIEHCCYVLHFKLVRHPRSLNPWSSTVIEEYKELIRGKYISKKYNHQQNKPSCAFYNFGKYEESRDENNVFESIVGYGGGGTVSVANVTDTLLFTHIFAYNQDYLFYASDYSKYESHMKYFLGCYDYHIAYRIVPLLTMFCNKKYQSQYWLKYAYRDLGVMQSFLQSLKRLIVYEAIKNNLDNLWRFNQRMELYGYIKHNFKKCKNNVFEITTIDNNGALIKYKDKNRDYMNRIYKARLDTERYNDLLGYYKDLSNHCNNIIEEAYSLYMLIDAECKYIESKINMMNVRVVLVLTIVSICVTVFIGA